MNLDQQLSSLRHLTMSAELSQTFQYDSACYLALAKIVEVVTGKSYSSFVEQEVFQPLDMSASFCDSNRVRESGRAADGYLRKGGDPQKIEMEPRGQPVSVGWWTQDSGFWCTPAGGIAMSMVDAVSLGICSQSQPLDQPTGKVFARAHGVAILAT